MAELVTSVSPSRALVEWLRRHGLEFEIHEHELAYTARHAARAEGVKPSTFAKVVMVGLPDGRSAMLVVDATDQVDLAKARRALDVGHVRLLREAEMSELAPDIEVGAMPAVGDLFGVPMYADFAVRDDAEISFNAGNHRFSVRVERAGWAKAAGVTYADLARDDLRPAWVRS